MSQAAIIKAIKKYRSFLVCAHVNPDPDALSSQLALAMYLQSQGKKVYTINEQRPPVQFKFMPGFEMLKTIPKKKIAFDAALIVDCGDLNRIGKVKKLIGKDHLIINIDHHITNDKFGDLNWIEPKASSTAEMLYDLLTKAGCKFTDSICKLLYLGIMTDTGSFRYDSTTPHAHHVAAQLMKSGFSVSELYRRVYERITLSDVKMFTKVINQFEIFHNGRAVCLTLHKDTLRKFSTEFDLRDKIFSFLRAIRGVEAIVVFSEQGQGKTRVNLRSQGNRVDVAKLAQYFGGGGHRKASGCVIDAPLPIAREKLLKQLKTIL